MHAALSEIRPSWAPIPKPTAEQREFAQAVKARRIYVLDYLAIPATPENDELLGDLCMLTSLCNRDGYRIKGFCTLDRGPCPFVWTEGNRAALIGWEFLPSPERFWIHDDFGRLNPVHVDSKLARVLREAFNEQLLERFNRYRLTPGVTPIQSAWGVRLNPEMDAA